MKYESSKLMKKLIVLDYWLKDKVEELETENGFLNFSKLILYIMIAPILLFFTAVLEIFYMALALLE